MADTAIAIATPDLTIVDGHITTTTQQVAQHFGKIHRDVVRAIENMECGDEFRLRNFAQSSFEAPMPNGGMRNHNMYRITRDGFTLLAMGFTGKEAMQWKLAYLNAFNQMEAQLLASTTRPANPAIDYDRISPAQAQDLKEIVQAIVKAGVQGFGETWNRFQRKFKVNSYLELPATLHLEARAYLLAKLPAGDDGAELSQPQPVQAPSLMNRRWLISFNHHGQEIAQPIDFDDCLLKYQDLPKLIAAPDNRVASTLLADIANACLQRLAHRAPQQAIPA